MRGYGFCPPGSTRWAFLRLRLTLERSLFLSADSVHSQVSHHAGNILSSVSRQAFKSFEWTWAVFPLPMVSRVPVATALVHPFGPLFSLPFQAPPAFLNCGSHVFQVAFRHLFPALVALSPPAVVVGAVQVLFSPRRAAAILFPAPLFLFMEEFQQLSFL